MAKVVRTIWTCDMRILWHKHQNDGKYLDLQLLPVATSTIIIGIVVRVRVIVLRSNSCNTQVPGTATTINSTIIIIIVVL